jgi:nucleotide-binding universal stress UspA family protein
MRLLSESPTFLVALKPKEDVKWLVEQSCSLAESFGGKIIFVQVIEPLNEAYIQTVFDQPALSSKIAEKIDTDRVSDAHQSLNNKIKPITDNATIVCELMVGELSESISSLAHKYDADCIVVGSKNRYNYLQSSMSNTISIMEKCQIPVMIFPMDSKFVKQKTVNIMMCDDLTDACQGVLNFTRNFSRIHTNTVVNHVNVLNIDELGESRWTSVFGFNETTLAKLTDKLEKRVLATLKDRFSFGQTESDIETVSYKASCFLGDTKKQISEAANKLDADLLICGNHSVIKIIPFGKGRLSWADMASLGKPVLIIKNQ